MKKKILTIVTLLVVSLIIGVIGTTVMAAELAEATVVDATKEDTKLATEIKEPTITSNTNGSEQTIEVVYTIAALKIIDGNDADRPDGYGWIGVNVKRPDGATKGVENDGTVYEANAFDQFFGINVEKLQKAVEDGTGYISYTKSYDWKYDDDNTGVTKTTLIVKIKAEGVTLQDKDDSESDDKTLWNKDEYVTYKLEVLEEELKEQGLAQKDIEERLQIAEELLADQDLTIEQLKAQIAELTAEKEAPSEVEKPVEEDNTSKTPEEKDNTPKTGVVDVALISSVVSMISVAGIVTVKKYSK